MVSDFNIDDDPNPTNCLAPGAASSMKPTTVADAAWAAFPLTLFNGETKPD
jgi:hypothetical protein